MTSAAIMARISVLISTFLLAGSWRCPTSNCLVYPFSLRLWTNQIEVSTRSVNVKAGADFSVTCDGSCVGSENDPHLRWYGPDKHWISYEGRHNRVFVEKSFSRRYQKLHITRAQRGDSGLYVCRGWLGEEKGWDTTSIRIQVQAATPMPVVTTRRTTAEPPRVLTTTTSHERLIIMHEQTTEQSIPMTTGDSCPVSSFQCESGECFDDRYRCDAFPDCIDGSDESDCASQTCSEDMIACTDGHGCVSPNQICDGVRQCRDASDENTDVCYNP